MGLSIISDPEMSTREIGDYMNEIAQVQPTIREYAWVDTQGIVIASSKSEAIGINIKDRKYIKQILNGEEKVISDIVLSRLDNKPTFIVARGIRKGNNLSGIVMATIDIGDLGKVLPSKRTNSSSSFGLIDGQGFFVYRYGIPDIANRLVKVKRLKGLF